MKAIRLLCSVLLAVLLGCFSLVLPVEAGHSHASASSGGHSHSGGHSGGHSGSHSSSHCHTHSHGGAVTSHHWFSFFGHGTHRAGNSNTIPSGATAECADGTFSFAADRQEACLNHGGVKRWLR
jgi:hypothetical protein